MHQTDGTRSLTEDMQTHILEEGRDHHPGRERGWAGTGARGACWWEDVRKGFNGEDAQRATGPPSQRVWKGERGRSRDTGCYRLTLTPAGTYGL